MKTEKIDQPRFEPAPREIQAALCGVCVCEELSMSVCIYVCVYVRGGGGGGGGGERCRTAVWMRNAV